MRAITYRAQWWVAFSFVLCGLVLVGLPFVSPGFLHLPWAEELPPDIDPVRRGNCR
jgi:hypothetical protein